MLGAPEGPEPAGEKSGSLPYRLRVRACAAWAQEQEQTSWKETAECVFHSSQRAVLLGPLFLKNFVQWKRTKHKMFLQRDGLHLPSRSTLFSGDQRQSFKTPPRRSRGRVCLAFVLFFHWKHQLPVTVARRQVVANSLEIKQNTGQNISRSLRHRYCARG